MRGVMLAVLVLLAGCVGSEPQKAADIVEPSSTADTAVDLPDIGPDLGYTLPDPWLEGETERILFEGVVQTGDCYAGAMAFELFAGYVMGGCGDIILPEGSSIPSGTATVRIEADASQALKSGEYFAFLYTPRRSTPDLANEAPTREPIHVWEIPMEEADWDPYWAKNTLSWSGYWSANNGTSIPVLNGPVPTKVVALRDPAWEPPLAPHPTTLLDAELAWVDGSGINLATRRGTQLDALDMLPIPPEARAISIAVTWEVISCPPGIRCWVNEWLEHEGTPYYGGVLGQTDNSRVISIGVPDPLPPDLPGGNVSAASVQLFVPRCNEADPLLPCFVPFYAYDAEVKAHVLVQAWTGIPDLLHIQREMGLATG